MTKTFYVYMMTSRSRVVLYTGITNSLVRRVLLREFRRSTERNLTRERDQRLEAR